MSPVTELARLAGRILSSVYMRNFNPVTVHTGNFSSVTEINETRTFKFHHGYRAGVFIWEHFHPGSRDLGNRASPPSHINTSKLLRRKEW